MKFSLPSALFCTFFLLATALYAQPRQGQARLDSLLAEVPKMGEDTTVVNLMEAISLLYYTINPDEGLKWADKELKLSQKLGWQKGKWKAYNDFGNNYLNKGAYPDAQEAFFKSLRIAEQLQDTRLIGIASGNIGNVYMRRKEHAKALQYQFKALKIAETRGDKLRMQLALGNIGIVYSIQEKNEEALVYQKRSLALAEELKNQNGIIVQTGNLGSTYTSLKQYAQALAYSFYSLRTAQKMGDKQTMAINLGNIGETYYTIATDSLAPKADSLVSVSRDVNLQRAVDYLQKGLQTCREARFPEGIPEFSDYLSKALTRQGHQARAMEAYQQSVSVKDSLYNAAIVAMENQKALEIQLKNKDLQIVHLKKRNERILSVSGFAVLLLILGILLRGYRKQRRSNALLAREKKRSDDLLLNILPAEVAEELKDKGGAVAKQYKEVSVLFTDFVDFTTTAQQLSPQMLVQELHECFTAFDTIIERNGLEKIKTIGDAYMAVCGLPVADAHHAQKAVQAALEIRDFIAERAKQKQVFQIRIGVNSGEVVAGIVGVKKFAYDIWGDTVNTAARMESAGKPGTVNISESTYTVVKNVFRCTPRGKIVAKGKGEVEMFFVEAPIALKAPQNA